MDAHLGASRTQMMLLFASGVVLLGTALKFISQVNKLREAKQHSPTLDRSAPWAKHTGSFWTKVVPLFSDAEFATHFRLPRSVFDYVCDRIRTHPLMAASSAKRMSVELCLAITLMRLGYNMGYKWIRQLFGVSHGSIRNATDRTLQAIQARLEKEWISDLFPSSSEEYRVAAISMSRVGRAVFPNCIGALDVTHVNCYASSWGKHRTKEDFIDKKGRASMSSQCVVNGNLQFIDVESGFPGRRHDMALFSPSGLGFHGVKGILRAGFYLLADAGYSACNFLLRPFQEYVGMPRQAVYMNYLISTSRMVVERAFGILKQRFRALLYGIHVHDVNEVAHWFVVAVILHNICRAQLPDDSIPGASDLDKYMEKVNALPDDINSVYINGRSAEDPDSSAPGNLAATAYRHVRKAHRAEITRMNGVQFRDYLFYHLPLIEKAGAREAARVAAAKAQARQPHDPDGNAPSSAQRRRRPSVSAS